MSLFIEMKNIAFIRETQGRYESFCNICIEISKYLFLQCNALISRDYVDFANSTKKMFD